MATIKCVLIPESELFKLEELRKDVRAIFGYNVPTQSINNMLNKVCFLAHRKWFKRTIKTTSKRYIV